jgi:hypothetical protein
MKAVKSETGARKDFYRAVACQLQLLPERDDASLIGLAVPSFCRIRLFDVFVFFSDRSALMFQRPQDFKEF